MRFSKLKNLKLDKTFFLDFLRLLLAAVIIGTLGGLIGGIFSFILSSVTHARESSSFLLFLLPLGGIVTVWLYNVASLSNSSATNGMITSLRAGKKINPLIAPLIFAATSLTHLFGGSAGREGAALQLGGAGASALADFLRVEGRRRAVFVMSGMSAVFAGLFGTPLTAAVFILEFKASATIFALAVIPCFLSSFLATFVSDLMVNFEETPIFSGEAVSYSFGKIFVLAIAISALATVLCFVFENVHKYASYIIRNPYIRIIAGAAAIILLTLMVGDMRYNGSGMDMVLRATTGRAGSYDYLLKLLFTAVTLWAGFRGGEIVPTFCIGATFGCVFGGALGLPPAFAAALGLIGLFACAAKSFLGGILLGAELFGFSALPVFIFVCLIARLLSPDNGLFVNRGFGISAVINFFKNIKRERN